MKDFVETPSLAAEAYNVVRERILRGELVLGQAISRRKLAAELGMSFLPVSEALLRLEVEGLLESRPRAKLAARVDAVAVQPDRTLYTVLHHKLHRRIAECARCPMLCDAIEKTHALASIWFCLLRQPLPDDPPRRHQDLVDVLTTGRPKEAADAMRQHVAVGMAHTLEVLTPYFKTRKADSGTFFRSEKRRHLQGIVLPAGKTKSAISE